MGVLLTTFLSRGSEYNKWLHLPDLLCHRHCISKQNAKQHFSISWEIDLAISSFSPPFFGELVNI
jgi:hypothetical protein